MAHRAFIEALAGYYNAGHILLRSTLELLLKGAFWECLAHKEFRENAEILNKEKRSLLDWFNDKIKPEVEREFEEISTAIFDKTAPIFEDRELQKLIPDIKTIIAQLDRWGILDPIPKPVEKVYGGIYRELCKEVHVIPDKTDIGRRLLQQKDLFEITIMPRELNKFLETLHKIMDVGIVIELNILSDWIERDGEVKARLKERLPTIKDLELKYSFICLQKRIEENKNS